MTIRQVLLFSVPVSDQDRARDFYVDVLGFEPVNDQQIGPGMRWVQVRPPGGGTSITLVTWFDSMPAGSLRGTVYETEDLDAEVEKLTGLGVVIPDGVQQSPWGRWVQFPDPDGNGIVVQQSARFDQNGG